MSRLPPPLPPSDYPVLLRRSLTWRPEELGLARVVVRQARTLAGRLAHTPGRRDAIARHLLALASAQAGRISVVARIPLFQAPGLLLADPERETFYWSLDPGLPDSAEREAVVRLARMIAPGQEPVLTER